MLPGEVRDVRQVDVGRVRPPRGVGAQPDRRRPALRLPRLAGRRRQGRRRRHRRRRRGLVVQRLHHPLTFAATEQTSARRRRLRFVCLCSSIGFQLMEKSFVRLTICD